MTEISLPSVFKFKCFVVPLPTNVTNDVCLPCGGGVIYCPLHHIEVSGNCYNSNHSENEYLPKFISF